MNKRQYKKKYKQAVEYIADRIPKAFKSKADRNAWVTYVINARMDDMKRGKGC